MRVTHVTRPTNWICFSCGKRPVSSLNKPHSQHKTKRTVRPNLQPTKQGMICTRCLKSVRNKRAI